MSQILTAELSQISMNVAYDLSRLLLRSFSGGPNGIDRVDLNLARHFVGGGQAGYGILLNRLRPAVISSQGAARFLDNVELAWRENIAFSSDESYQALRRRILQPASRVLPTQKMSSRIAGPSRSWLATALGFAPALIRQIPLVRRVPKGAAFIHATNFPIMPLFRWLGRRSDVRAVFFLHDLLPLRIPELFTAENAEQHRLSLEVFVRYAHAAIVHTEAVKSDVIEYLKAQSVRNKQILVAPMPAAPIFAKAEAPDPELRAQPYFVVCGTIEPRKNHLLLLKVWQELVRSEGASAPKLIIIGRRGWKNQEVFDLLDQAPWVASHVIEVAGLSTPAMKHVMANSCALLMPSFAEGYGLPITEARAAGVPVIAADIAVFRDRAEEGIRYCDPHDTASWLAAIRDCTKSEWKSSATAESENNVAWKDYFQKLTEFIARL